MPPLGLLIFALAGIALYIPTNRLAIRRYLTVRWDRRVPLIPVFIIPYLSLFPYVGFAFLVAAFSPLAHEFLIAFAAASWTAALIWVSGGFGVKRPAFVPRGPLGKVILWVYRHDNCMNAFPSSHVTYSLLAAYYLALLFPSFSFVIWVWGILIAISTVLVKQHNLPDIAGGMALATASAAFAQVFVAAMTPP